MSDPIGRYDERHLDEVLRFVDRIDREFTKGFKRI
jgi:hypothetical protein